MYQIVNPRKKLLPLVLLALVAFGACTEDESNLGINLQDPFTIYDGVRDTAYVTACTLFDDSLSATGVPVGVFGDFVDANFGSVTAVLYSQISTPEYGVRITDSVQIDSVVMTLVVDTVYPVPADSTPVPLHIVIHQLAEAVRTDSAYLITDSLEESSVCFFDGVVTYVADSIRIPMNENMIPILQQVSSQEDFLNSVKGISFRLAPNSRQMVSVDLATSNTRLTVYYRNPSIDTISRQFVFTINEEVAHGVYVKHDYSGTPLANLGHGGNDTLEGSAKLYLEPLGGTRVRLNLQPFLNRFAAEHPTAIIHYAELLLPVYDTADTQTPVRIMAVRRSADGRLTYITDANVLSNPYTYSGFDGGYHRDRHLFRLRVTRHLQELIRSGKDYGTELLIDARRTSAFRTVINGTATDNPIRIDFVYSDSLK